MLDIRATPSIRLRGPGPSRVFFHKHGDGPDIPRRSYPDRPADDEQRILSNFNPDVVVVVGDVTFDAGEDGQAPPTGLIADRTRAYGGSDAF